ncbi:MAG: hypothetical protein QM704_21775 [Anaeromyxobacteraceae bacterium]
MEFFQRKGVAAAPSFSRSAIPALPGVTVTLPPWTVPATAPP